MSDLISRQAAIDCEYQVKTINDIEYVMLSEVQMKMRKLPSAQPERKRGKWKPYRCDMYECSECGYIYTELTDRHKCGANYCPNCGEDMRGEQDDESRSNSNAQTDTRARGMGATDKSSGI